MKMFKFLFLGLIIAVFSSCATCRVNYPKNLTDDPRLEEANVSYRKAIHWASLGDCETHPAKAAEDYRNAESYFSDTVYKLNYLGHDLQIDTSEQIYKCESLKAKMHEDIVEAEKVRLPSSQSLQN